MKQLKGRAKETVGSVAGDRTLEREGARQRAEGGVQERPGTARREVGEVLEELASVVKK